MNHPTAIRLGRRDHAGTVLRRFRSIADDAAVGDDGKLRLTLATDDAIDMGGWREVLVMDPAAIDRQAASALLINHDPNQIAGRIDALAVADGRMTADVTLLDGARLASGVTVLAAVRAKALRGVSIGYVYRMDDADIDERTRTVRVRRWRLLEATLTPIPIDPAAGVRAFPATTGTTPTPATPPMKITAAQLRSLLALAAVSLHDQISQRADAGASFDELKNWITAQAPATATNPPADIEAARAAARNEAQDVAALARSVGLPADDYVGQPIEAARAAILKKLGERHAAPTTSVTAAVTVTADAQDKLVTAVRANLYERAGIRPTAEEATAFARVGRASFAGALRRAAAAEGINADDRIEMAAFAARTLDLRSHGRRDIGGANTTVAALSLVLANVANKALVNGLANYNSQTWQEWCTQRMVADFKQVTNANLAVGRLTATNESEAFPELLKKDGGYNSQLGMYGATLSVSFQALVNDDLGTILQQLSRIGAIAGETIDREVYSALLNATWTNDNSASSGLATPANLDTPRAALKNKLSPAAQKMGIVAAYLLHSPGNAVAAQIATGQIYGPGTTTAPSAGSRSIRCIESQWIDDTGLLGGALSTDYYLTGSPSVVDTVLVNFLEGLGMSPLIMPFDAGAVAAEKYKVMLPFAATVATHSDGTNTRVTGMQRARA